MRSTLVERVFLPFLTLILLTACAWAQNFSGAIYTTINDGTGVNVNTFTDKSAVYLDGGPQNRSHNGLPDGQYYFQITDPSGRVLLSLDDIRNRRVLVANGELHGHLVDTGDPETFHGHADGIPNPADGSTDIQLQDPTTPGDFADTPNSSGVYKVWLTNVNDYNPSDPHSVFGFFPAKSKTDNFKVASNVANPQGELVIDKYYDANANGSNDGELPLDNIQFRVKIYPDNTTTGTPIIDQIFTSGTDGPGSVIVGPFDSNPNGNYYTVTEIHDGWTQSQPTDQSGYAGTVVSGGLVSLVFGDYQGTTISLHKYFDTDGPGPLGDTGVGLANFNFTLVWQLNGVAQPDILLVSDPFGNASHTFVVLPTDVVTYTLVEILPSGTKWIQTEGGHGGYTGSFTGGGHDQTYAFGNYQQVGVTVHKFFDQDGPGSGTAGTSIDGFHFTLHWSLNGTAQPDIPLVSGDDGANTGNATHNFIVSASDTIVYSISEDNPSSPWLRSPQTPDVGPFTITGGQDAATYNFGNYQQTTLSIFKYFDANANGVQDGGETGVGGFSFTVHWSLNGTAQPDLNLTTDATGNVSQTWIVNAGDSISYSVSEDAATGYALTQSTNTSGTLIGGGTATATFGNARTRSLSIFKFYDSNADGAMNGSEGGLAGIKYHVVVYAHQAASGPTVIDTYVFTGAGGTITVGPFPADTVNGNAYVITEVLPTTPASGTWICSLPLGGVYTGVMHFTDPGAFTFGDFFGRQVGNGHTIGFWSNKNGQALVTNTDLANLRVMNLCTDGGGVFDPTTYNQFRGWLLYANATNMACMCSAQLSAMYLNVQHVGLDPNTLVFVPSTDMASGASIVNTLIARGVMTQAPGGGTITIAALMSAANTECGLYPMTRAAGPERTYEECLKTLMDQLNNNGAIGGGIVFVSPTPPVFVTPY